jgi:hypothetical protein
MLKTVLMLFIIFCLWIDKNRIKSEITFRTWLKWWILKKLFLQSLINLNVELF